MDENEIVTVIIDKAMEIHRRLGPGLLENANESILGFELMSSGLNVSRQVTVPMVWKSITVDEAFRADMIIEHKVIVEIKSVEKLTKVHAKQLLTYLRLSREKARPPAQLRPATIKGRYRKNHQTVSVTMPHLLLGVSNPSLVHPRS